MSEALLAAEVEYWLRCMGRGGTICIGTAREGSEVRAGARTCGLPRPAFDVPPTLGSWPL